MKTPIYITVREGGAPVIERYPDGFPVDGDALHHGSRTLKKRALDLIAADPELLSAARAWLGLDSPSRFPTEGEELTPRQIGKLVDQLYTGGASRFVAYVPTPQKAVAA
jgi:hypothetical protein